MTATLVPQLWGCMAPSDVTFILYHVGLCLMVNKYSYHIKYKMKWHLLTSRKSVEQSVFNWALAEAAIPLILKWIYQLIPCDNCIYELTWFITQWSTVELESLFIPADFQCNFWVRICKNRINVYFCLDFSDLLIRKYNFIHL